MSFASVLIGQLALEIVSGDDVGDWAAAGVSDLGALGSAGQIIAKVFALARMQMRRHAPSGGVNVTGGCPPFSASWGISRELTPSS